MIRLAQVLAMICAISACSCEADWTDDAQSVVDHLNKWPKDDLDAFERKEGPREPNHAYDRTCRHVIAHQAHLKRLHAKSRWDHQNQRYVLVKN